MAARGEALLEELLEEIDLVVIVDSLSTLLLLLYRSGRGEIGAVNSRSTLGNKGRRATKRPR